MCALPGYSRPVAGLAVVLLLVPVIGGEFAAYQIGLYLIYAMVAQGIALTWGRAGFLPLGQSLFFGLGAYLGGFGLRAMGAAFPDASAPLFRANRRAWHPRGAHFGPPTRHRRAADGAAALLPAALAWLVGRLVFARRHESGPYFSLITLALAMLGFPSSPTNGAASPAASTASAAYRTSRCSIATAASIS